MIIFMRVGPLQATGWVHRAGCKQPVKIITADAGKEYKSQQITIR